MNNVQNKFRAFLFGGRPFAISASKEVMDFQANSVRCPHCQKKYMNINDLEGLKIIDEKHSHSRSVHDGGAHCSFTIKFMCKCSAIITVVSPLSENEYNEASSLI